MRTSASATLHGEGCAADGCRNPGVRWPDLAAQFDSAALSGLGQLDDQAVLDQLTAIKGIGPWTAKIYLLMVLRRPDVWPVGDIALASAVGNMRGMEKRPTQPELTKIAKDWRPHRASAARMLWHYYLNGMP